MEKYYKTLGLEKDTSQKEIQQAYEKLSKELNPSDNYNQEFFIEEYKKVQEAYEALSNSSILATEKGAKLNSVGKNSLSTKEIEKFDESKNDTVKTNNPLSFINRIKSFFSKKINWGILIFLISLIIIIQFIKPISFNESIKMEIKGNLSDSLEITLVDYGSSKLIPSKLLNYRIKNLNGKWIELSKVYDGDNKFHIDNMEMDNFMELMQYDTSKKNVFIYYPYLISKNNKVVNLISECFNENFFVKKNVMKISIKRGDLKNIPVRDFVKWLNKAGDLKESFY
jgi:hypothetical protein